MGSDLKQILTNSVRNAFSAFHNFSLENSLEQNEIGNIYDETALNTSEYQSNGQDLSVQDEQDIDMLSQEIINASAQNGDEAGRYYIGANYINWFSPFIDEETKDGAIAETEQNSMGDCWLLSGINALSYTQEGRKIIENSFEYKNDYTVVHLDGVMPGYSVIVTDRDIAGAKNNSNYSSGDTDMAIFELAIEKLYNDIANGVIVVDPNCSSFFPTQESIQEKLKEGDSSIKAGYMPEVFSIVTGKQAVVVKDKDMMRDKLEEFEQNGNKDLAIGASISESEELGDFEIEDVNGESHAMGNKHAYAIKSVENGIVTVINPWNSGEEIPMEIDDFVELFSSMSVCDLSEKNRDFSLSKSDYELDEDGNRLYEFEYDNGKYNKLIQTYTCDELEGKECYGGYKIKDIYVNESTQDSLVVNYDEEGNKTGSIETVHVYSDDGEIDGYTKSYLSAEGVIEEKHSYDKDGNLDNIIYYDEEGNFFAQVDCRGLNKKDMNYIRKILPS